MTAAAAKARCESGAQDHAPDARIAPAGNPPPSAAAERQRRHRANQRAGRICITLSIDVSVVQRLIEIGRLAVADCDDRAAIRDALEASTVEIK